jgi:hypothetical protein
MKHQILRFGALFLAMLACFMLGAYAADALRNGDTVEPHKWVLTAIAGIVMLTNFFILSKRND